MYSIYVKGNIIREAGGEGGGGGGTGGGSEDRNKSNRLLNMDYFVSKSRNKMHSQTYTIQ